MTKITMPKSKSFKQLVTDFNTAKPNFTPLIPYLTGEIKENLENFTGDLVGKWGAIKTLWQLSQLNDPERSRRTKSRSRIWKSTNGYIFLVSWSNASLLRVLGVKWFTYLKSPKSPLTSSKGWKYIDRLEGQFLDELRSVIANIEEGFARPNTQSYLDFLGYSQGSLKEAKGDVQRAKQDGILKSVPGTGLQSLRIDLKDWHEALKESVISKPTTAKPYKSPFNSFKRNYRNLEEFKFNYPPVDNLDPKSLTYEMFIELINKTDWNLRKLVESLEQKQNTENKFYQVEQSRLRKY